MNMTIETLLNENQEILDLVRHALLSLHGRDYTDKQIREAFTIGILIGDTFQDVITKINRQRYGCEECKNKHGYAK